MSTEKNKPSPGEWERAERDNSPRLFLSILWFEAAEDLTFARVASFDVSGDADNGQGVDARQAEEQSEETVYLEENRREGEDSVSLLQLGGNHPSLLRWVCVDLFIC